MERAEEAFRRTSYGEALDHAQAALSHCQLEQDALGEALAMSWVGAAYTQHSRYDLGLDHLETAIRRLNELGREDLTARAINYKAIVHEELDDYTRAFALYGQALTIARGSGQLELEGRILANIGDAHVNLGELDKALPFLSEAGDKLLAAGQEALYGWSLWGIGRIHAQRGEAEEARHCFEQALAAAEGGGALRIAAECHVGLGSLLRPLGQEEQAFDHLYKALELAERAQVKREVFKCHLALSEAHEQQGDYEQALAHFKSFHEVRSQVFDEVARARSASVVASLELERERHARELSHLRNVELAAALTQLERQAEELAQASIRDSLTGIYNRRYLDERLPLQIEECARREVPLSVAIADVDHFKRINDRLGHAVGDRTLKTVVEVMAGELRNHDLLARYGGEEFVLVFPDTALEDGVLACERIREALERKNWSTIHPNLKVSASFGVATAPISGRHANDWERLLTAADARLYLAKHTGRNRVCF